MQEYLEIVSQMYANIQAEEEGRIGEVADRLAKSIIAGQIAHIFGTGHSEMVCKEVFSSPDTIFFLSLITDHGNLCPISFLIQYGRNAHS